MISPTSDPHPTGIRIRRRSRLLEVSFADGARFDLPFEYLRVYSPSAEVRGHSPDQAVLQVGKEAVGISGAEPIGQYAVRLSFDDGHDTGLFTWKYLYELGRNHEANWQDYLNRLDAAGYRRDSRGDDPQAPA